MFHVKHLFRLGVFPTVRTIADTTPRHKSISINYKVFLGTVSERNQLKLHSKVTFHKGAVCKITYSISDSICNITDGCNFSYRNELHPHVILQVCNITTLYYYIPG